MIFYLYLLLLAPTIATAVLSRQYEAYIIKATQIVFFTLIAITVYLSFKINTVYAYQLSLINFNDIALNIQLQFDILAKIMMGFILVIGFLIYHYAQNYLESDQTRLRFLAQFNLVISSVLLLVTSANLLTAFIAWQFIGINLYLLLNHYHLDPAANRAAKKKFVINRVGDCSFLLAMILTYHTSPTALFSAISTSPNSGLICSLLFISVMTKCAQFPFHIWLLDTMETPTPVSALMHAGVINAGGVLLARISPALSNVTWLNVIIVTVGITSAVLSIQWMRQQADVKKKLAYSTMGQMGYMLVQCGLGAFSAAIFHLIAHGFYKASLFLNAGETLNQQAQSPIYKARAVSNQQIIYAALIAALIVLVCFLASSFDFSHLPILVIGFIYLTLWNLVLKTNQVFFKKLIACSITYLGITGVFLVYLMIYDNFSHLLGEYEYYYASLIFVEVLLLLAFVCLQVYFWKKPFINPDSRSAMNISSSRNLINLFNKKDYVECWLRLFLLKPLRMAGNIVNLSKYKAPIYILYLAAFVFSIMGLTHGIHSEFYSSIKPKEILFWPMLLSLLLATSALVVANRCLSIKKLIIFLFLYELLFSNLAWFDGDTEIIKIGVLHLVTMSLVLIMLGLLARRKSSKAMAVNKTVNKFPIRVFYLIFGLLLLIGIPGTASFISEFYLLAALISTNIVFVLLYMTLIVLASIVIMHSLQLYVFNKNYSSLLSQPVSKQEHIIYITIIGLNITLGIFPNILLGYL